MNWFQQNRARGTALIVFAIATLASLYFLWSAKSSFDQAKARFNENAAELNRLERLTPFPAEANVREMKVQAEEYGAQLDRLKEELKGRTLPVTPLAPNEFQSRLRQAIIAITDKARVNRVKLPANFSLGFDEYRTALPDTELSPVLGQQLAQVELLLNLALDARVDAINSLQRIAAGKPAAAAGPGATPAATPTRKAATPAAAAAPPLLERSAVDLSFSASPGAARRILNQIAAANQQFYITRTLHVLNEKENGPAREAAASAVPTAASTPGGVLNFIVGTERIQIFARIEMVRFALP